MVSEDQYVIYIICGVMAMHALVNKRHFSFYLYNNCYIENKRFYYLEKILMVVLPLIIICLSTFLTIHPFVIRLWIILIVLLDFALQYFAKECEWLSINKEEKVSSSLIIWIVFVVAVFFTIKS